MLTLHIYVPEIDSMETIKSEVATEVKYEEITIIKEELVHNSEIVETEGTGPRESCSYQLNQSDVLLKDEPSLKSQSLATLHTAKEHAQVICGSKVAMARIDYQNECHSKQNGNLERRMKTTHGTDAEFYRCDHCS